MSYGEWCIKNDCTHGHCPNGCEHPQPFFNDHSLDLICGKCYHDLGNVVSMIPCNKEICDIEV